MKEQLILLRNRERYDEGTYNPLNAAQYLECDGFVGLKRALSMTGEEIITEVKDSGLRGRGGAGFPTWRKLEFTAISENDVKYVVCNADEGEPGTNKDRVLLTVDPCAIFEGMAIAGKAIGSHKGYIYLRAEYRYMFDDLEAAIRSCKENNCLGENIFGSGFDFDIELRMGNGAYVCGEETALFESIEGKRGEPRFRPPYPATYGLFGKPTVSNNVETLANLAPIFRNGAKWYAGFGTEGSTGTKLFTVSGNIYRKGVFELPMGANLKELIYGFCGGIADGRGMAAAFMLGAKGIQMGTVFAASKESVIHENYKNSILKAKDIDSRVTGRSTGHPIRVLRNDMARKYLELEKSGAPFEELEQLTLGSLRKAVQEGDTKNGSLMAGQIAGMIKEERTCADIISSTVSEAGKLMNGVSKNE